MADWAVDRHDELGLDLYIPPEMVWERPKSASLGQAQEWETFPVEGEPAERLEKALAEIFNGEDRHLLLVNDAGMGKTIASLQVQHLLSDRQTSVRIFPDGQRRLVFHFARSLPVNHTASLKLVDLLHAAAVLEIDDRATPAQKNQTKIETKAAIEYALEQNRVVVIIDGFDELGNDGQKVVETLFNQSHKSVRWIITSRDDSVGLVSQYQWLFQPKRFLRLRLRLFDQNLQDRFMNQQGALPGIGWRDSLLGPKEGWDEMLGSPYVLATIIRLFKQSSDPGSLRFSSPSDLFLQYSREMLTRELGKSNHQDFLREKKVPANAAIPVIERVLGALALEMALRGHWGVVSHPLPTQLQTDFDEIWQTALNRFNRLPQVSKLASEWKWVRGFIEHFETDMAKGIGFRTRRTQELWAARYLTVYASAEDLKEIHCKALGDGRWSNLWKSVIWMPLEDKNSSPFGADRSCYLKALKLLFERPKVKTYRRPTELMWIAEQWLEGNRESEMLAELYGHLQGQFEEMRNKGTKEQKEAIDELLDRNRYVFLECRQGAKLKDDTGEFEMGPDKHDGNRTVNVTLSPFALCKYQLTRKQARIWDEGFAGNDEVAAGLSWEDSYFFFRMLGRQSIPSPSGGLIQWLQRIIFNLLGRQSISSPSRQTYYFTLPTEAQWEYACRAGSKDDFCFGNDVANLKNFAWYADSTYWSGGEQGPQPVGQKQENAWGLYDMHGNVWEWCWDWLDDYEKKPQKDPTGPSQGSLRVNRGGGWSNVAASCRSADRGGYYPSFRGRGIGFRVALSSRGIPQQAEPARVE